MKTRGFACGLVLAMAAAAGVYRVRRCYAQAGPRTTATPQKIDEEYTARIKKATPDPRILTELVDHMPASATVPSPLKFFGYVPGEPGNLTYHADIVRYYEALEKASPRVKLFRIGKSDEGRDMVALAIADEATIKQLDKYKQITARLTDPRKLPGGGSEAADRDRQADLLRDRQHPHAGARQPRDADRAGVPSRGRGIGVHPDDPQQLDRRADAGDRSGRA